MKDRIILHCDLNNFFASVALLSHPTLYNLPVAVCGSSEDRHGIVLAKNELAKKFGVKTAEATWVAKSKCPDLVVLPPDYQEYRKYSLLTREILGRYTDLIEPFGIDEAWLDVTGSTLLFGNGYEIAERIRKTVKKELGLTVSIGVSFNKVFAKLGSDLKKPDAVTVIDREHFRDQIWNLPAADLLFVGKNTAEKLKSRGILTIGDLAACPERTLHDLLGKTGPLLRQYALGEDRSPVCPPDENECPKSIGRSVTPRTDLTDEAEVFKIFVELAEQIVRQLRRYDLFAGNIQVHTRTSTLKVREFSRTLEVPLNTSMEIARKGIELFRENYHWDLPLRSVGLRISNFKSGDFAVQEDLFGESADDGRAEQNEQLLQSVRERFGNTSLRRGRTLDPK